jgi:hypothetical protein
MERADDLYLDYWRQASLAELTATAQVRHSALERILPRTKIADRCDLTERYLFVRGQLHTYKIHLGCASVLMEPGIRTCASCRRDAKHTRRSSCPSRTAGSR